MFKKVCSKIMGGVHQVSDTISGAFDRASNAFGRVLLTGLMTVTGMSSAFAQDGGGGSYDLSTSANAIDEAAGAMAAYIEPVQKVCYIIAALIGLAGGLTTAIAMSNHEQDVTKKVAFTLGGMAFMVVVGYLIPLFFGLSGS